MGARYLSHLTSIGRRRSTLGDYESYLRVHLVPFFGDLPLDKVARSHVEGLIAEKIANGRAPKAVRNYVGLLHSIFVYAERQGWRTGNPCKGVELPAAPDEDAEIRFLDDAERGAPAGHARRRLGPLDRVLYLTAGMTGLRQGELLALRWRDVDWSAARIRVRQSYVWGEFGRPKSKRSSRSVPLAMRLATELERHFQATEWQGDDDLVFGRPVFNTPLDRSALRRRFKRSLARASEESPVPRPAPHLRDAHGGGGHAAADAAGMDEPPRLQDDPDLRGPPAVGARGGVRRACVWDARHVPRSCAAPLAQVAATGPLMTR